MDERLDAVVAWLKGLQDAICARVGAFDPDQEWRRDCWSREEGGGGDSRVLEDGDVIERGGVNFSLVHGASLPPSATQRKPELAGRSFWASGVSLVMHPRNPYVPTSHMNVRFFIAEHATEPPVWWFGGGFDLTPYYPFDEDTAHWHATAQESLAPYGTDLYARFRDWCDEYFYLPHRGERRGVGGLFFDDLNELGFEQSFALTRAVGEAYLTAWAPLVERRRDTPYGKREREFQSYRRGRYVEFNLVYDRGTLFGLQSRGRAESILMSMPPTASWRYDWAPDADTPEHRIMELVRR